MTDLFPSPAPDQPLPTYAGDPGRPAPPAAFLPPVAPPPRRRPALIVAIVGSALGLVLLAGAATAVYVAIRHASAPADGRATPSASAAAGPKHLRFAASETVGAWHKTADAGQADMLAKSLANKGLTETFGAVYRDEAGHSALVGGGNSAEYGNGREYNQAASLAMGIAQGLNHVPATTQVPADPGIIGGVAACSPAGSDAYPATACVWIADDLVLVLVFDGLSLDDATGQIHAMLPDLVVFA
ncbi:hypothetical protein GCM10010170_055070 [Dactylosporangium salmoneum]|uniref:Uncharacterized protein n=2 Tax=Dactylosporangium salmoneum TaxID=53361 RepID=A0ABN3GSU1_9ACTN